MNRADRLTISIFCNIILTVALVITAAVLVPMLLHARAVEEDADTEADTTLPTIEVDENALLQYAADYDVSMEYLQLVLPEYFLYMQGGTYVFAKIDPTLLRHNYDWTCLTYADGRRQYQDARYPGVSYGIDVSQYQGEVDWQKVAADGVDFAMIRVGYRGYGSGKLMVDETAAENLTGAIAAGLKVGAYFFSQAVSEEEAIEEAEMTLALIEAYPITYPVAFDMEEIHEAEARIDSLSIEERTAIAKAFCKRIKKADYTPAIYGNTRWLAGKLDLTQVKDYGLWFAQYHERPLFPYNFGIWQYTANGTVDGIEGQVDWNISFGLQALE